MRNLGIIMKFKGRGLSAHLRESGARVILRNAASIIVFGSFAVGVFFLSRGITAFLLEEAHIGLFLYHRFLSMLLYVLFITVNLGNILVCYATLYKSDEVRFLMGLPVRHETVFLVKFLDNFFYSSSTLALLGLSLLAGYGSYFGVPWYFYPVSAFGVLLPFLLIAALSAVIVLMILLRVAARYGIRRLLIGLTAVYGGLVYFYFSETNPVQMVQEMMRRYPDVNGYFGNLDPPFVSYLPNQWVTDSLYWWVHGDPVNAIPSIIMLLSSLAGLLFVARFTAQQVYYRSWLYASDGEASNGKRRWRFRLRIMEFPSRSPLNPAVSVIVKRDFWLFVRDPAQWLHMLLMMVLLVIFLFSLGSLEVRLAQPLLQAVSYLTVFAFNGFMVASICLRFVFPFVSVEGEAFWCMRSSPISLGRLYSLKLGMALLFVVALGEVLAVASSTLLNHSPGLVALSASCTGFVALALTSMHLSGGAYFASFKEKNAIRVASSQGASLTFLLSMTYLAFVAMVLLIPLMKFFENAVITGVAPTAWLYPPAIGIGAFSIFIALFSSSVGLRAMKREV